MSSNETIKLASAGYTYWRDLSVSRASYFYQTFHNHSQGLQDVGSGGHTQRVRELIFERQCHCYY